MSYSIFLLKFVDSEVVALDAVRFRQVTEPYVVAGSPEEGFSQLRAEDGGEADLYHGSHGASGMTGVTVTHFAKGAMLGVISRLAAALGASIVPQEGDALIFHEKERRHLPVELRGNAVVIVPAADALQAAFDAR
ncbi:hypothetical protein AB0E21_33820 [Streptomyces sp. NPDC047967]|uniref:hypothetical protein n=1 Tax=unclassified Streptomyces TaxID=2593676 RepID=UPI001C0D7001|nr:hypothetical protein [Streptomyces sp. YPW6]QWQ45365.1 hypothetical protein KME66_33550 [Streptomyces sp. YPW6]